MPQKSPNRRNLKTKALIESLFEYPTAPFREAYISQSVKTLLIQNRIPFYKDSFGNIVAGTKDALSFKKHKGLVFLAHMDHPGFHVKSSTFKGQKTILKVEWLGGAPFKKMVGSKVRIHDPESSDPRRGTLGIVTKVAPAHPGKRERDMIVEIPRRVEFSKYAFGAFAYPAHQIRGNRLSGRVCDDLTGVALCLAVLLDTNNSRDCVSVFTRAEEVGFVGCWAQLKKKHYRDQRGR